MIQIEGSEFDRSLNPWVAGEKVSADVAQDFIEVLTAIRNEAFLLVLPGRPSGFSLVTEFTYAKAAQTMQRMEGLFPTPPKKSEDP